MQVVSAHRLRASTERRDPFRPIIRRVGCHGRPPKTDSTAQVQTVCGKQRNAEEGRTETDIPLDGATRCGVLPATLAAVAAAAAVGCPAVLKLRQVPAPAAAHVVKRGVPVACNSNVRATRIQKSLQPKTPPCSGSEPERQGSYNEVRQYERRKPAVE